MENSYTWGRLPTPTQTLQQYALPAHFKEALANADHSVLPYGNGRSYGDVCLNSHGEIWSTKQLNRFIAFDDTTGRLSCEAGILLQDIQRIFVPKGWILPVTPGTQLITVGGAIANDIHGKNHHRLGTFGDHLLSFTLIRSTGEEIICSRQINPDWFSATIGGIGLTGIIINAELQLKKITSPWLDCENIPYYSLGEFFELSDGSESDWEHTVSWIDCMARKPRGHFMRANFSATSQEKSSHSASKRSFPIQPPFSLVNRLTLKPFNTVYFHTKKARKTDQVHYETFFYPLDDISHWNRLYGPRGFYQYQCVIPHQYRYEAIEEMLNLIRFSHQGSFLAVLKTFGKKTSVGMMSFPQHGVTLALDFANKGPKTLQLFSQLDHVVSQTGGRLYLAKDARMPVELFEKGYPLHSQFSKYRDPIIQSDLANRLLGKMYDR